CCGNLIGITPRCAVGRCMAHQAIGLGMDETRSATTPYLRHRGADNRIDSDYIVAIDGLGRHPTRLCARQGTGTGRHAISAGESGDPVVLADKQYGQTVERGPVEPLEKGAAVDRAVAEDTGDDGV